MMVQLGRIVRYLLLGAISVALILALGLAVSDELRRETVWRLGPYTVNIDFVGELPRMQRDALSESLQRAFADGRIPAAETLEALCKRSPWCDAFEFHLTLLPRAVTLVVRASVPEFVVESGAERWLISSKGELIQTVSTVQDTAIAMTAADLPLLQLDMVDLPKGLVASAAACARAAISAAPPHLRFEQFVVVNANEMRLISNGTDVPPLLIDCSMQKDLHRQVDRGLAVAGDLKARGELAQLLDLRTENQVIVK